MRGRLAARQSQRLQHRAPLFFVHGAAANPERKKHALK